MSKTKTEWTPELLHASWLNVIESSHLSDYLYCPTCDTEVDTYVFTRKYPTNHWCPICGSEVPTN